MPTYAVLAARCMQYCLGRCHTAALEAPTVFPLQSVTQVTVHCVRCWPHLRMTLRLPSGAVLICSSQCLGMSTCPAASSAATRSSSVEDRLMVAAPLNRPPLNRLLRRPGLLPFVLLLMMLPSSSV